MPGSRRLYRRLAGKNLKRQPPGNHHGYDGGWNSGEIYLGTVPERKARQNQRGFSFVLLSVPPPSELEEQARMRMTEKTANSTSARQCNSPTMADYLYQGATLAAALLLVLSAAV